MAVISEETLPFIVIFLGPPGAGKGTHAAPLSRMLKIPSISTGDLFREHICRSTSLGQSAKVYIDEGKLVPDELVLTMLFARVADKDCKRGFILDGFPRTVSQGEALQKKFEKSHQIVVLNFQIPDSCLIDRVCGRIVCKQCGAPYHKKTHPPKAAHVCDLCQGVLYERDDDKEAVLRKRLEVYRTQTEPLIAFYGQQNGMLKEIQANQPLHEVFAEIIQAVTLCDAVCN
jgi:adenylate kinase